LASLSSWVTPCLPACLPAAAIVINTQTKIDWPELC
jgi:hypothetical protein